MFVKTVADEDAEGRVAEIYAAQKAQLGFVMEATRCFTAKPDLLQIYTDFNERMRAGFSLGMRAWRLITLVAAKQVPSTYCSHVYSKQLVGDLGSKEAVLAVQRDFRNAGLTQKEVEMLSYAEKIAQNASWVSQSDVDRLRATGFSDAEICEIALCASFRCFVSRFFDALGARAEDSFIDADLEFREAMNVSRQS